MGWVGFRRRDTQSKNTFTVEKSQKALPNIYLLSYACLAEGEVYIYIYKTGRRYSIVSLLQMVKRKKGGPYRERSPKKKKSEG